jgi:ABC-type glycerol-3-phosphate transport system substrate-binding protein
MDSSNQFNVFQIGLIVVFVLMFIVGIFIFATNKIDNSNTLRPVPITIWGPESLSVAFDEILRDLRGEDESFKFVTYEGKNTYTMYGDLIEAIATGQGPDLVIMNSAGILPLKNKVFPISFETLPLSTFREMYIDGADIFTLVDGTYTYPLLVDPLVLYWNKDIFASAGMAEAPKDWDSFVSLVPRLSTIVGGSELTQSAVAFGEFDNVLHAKEILLAMIMQTGTDIVTQSADGKSFISVITGQESSVTSSDLALLFYTSFSNPVKTVYSWNKTFDRSREAFAANKVAMYAGFLSEEKILSEINPNLNFAMAVWPQSVNTKKSVTFGNFQGISVLKSSMNPKYALYVAQTLSSTEMARRISQHTGLPSVRRDVVSEINSTDPYANVKVQSAIIAKSWLEPAPISRVNELFAKAVNDTVSGSSNSSEALRQVEKDLVVLLEQYKTN